MRDEPRASDDRASAILFFLDLGYLVQYSLVKLSLEIFCSTRLEKDSN